MNVSSSTFLTPLPATAPLSEDVVRFCKRHALERPLEEAIRLVPESFRTVETLEVLIREDYENGEEWLSLRISIRASIEEALQAYEGYMQRWVKAVPWPEGGMIRLSYSVI